MTRVLPARPALPVPSPRPTLRPSTAHRWMLCPGAPAAEAGLPDRPSSFADEGTAAHELAALVLNGASAGRLLGRPLPVSGKVPGIDMGRHVRAYVDHVRSLAGVLSVETPLDLSDWLGEDAGGTADAVVDGREGLHVVDLKYGRGVRVSARGNPQLRLYALGALSRRGGAQGGHPVTTTIVQPRLEHVDSETMTVDDLLWWSAEALMPAVRAALAPGAPRRPSEEACRFCLARPTCPEAAGAASEALAASFDDLDAPAPPASLTDEDLSRALRLRPVIEGWLRSVAAHVEGRVRSGGFPGWKLVAGRGRRAWAEGSEGTLDELLGDAAWTRERVSPAQAERLLGRADRHRLDGIVRSLPGRPVLAPQDDPRPAVAACPDDFDEVAEVEE